MFKGGLVPPRNVTAGAASDTDLTSNELYTGSINKVFNQLLQSADGAVQAVIAANTDENGVLTLSSSQSLNMQKLMGDQSIAAQTATSVMKSIKDSISGAVRNIA